MNSSTIDKKTRNYKNSGFFCQFRVYFRGFLYIKFKYFVYGRCSQYMLTSISELLELFSWNYWKFSAQLGNFPLNWKIFESRHIFKIFFGLIRAAGSLKNMVLLVFNKICSSNNICRKKLVKKISTSF